MRTSLLPLIAVTVLATRATAQAVDTLSLAAVGTDPHWKIAGRTAALVDIKGKHALQLSEAPGMGVVWAVYFRPFNFRASDSTRHAHAVEYVSDPEWTWQRLRSERPGRYEKPVIPEPDGDAWFHARIEVAHPRIRVFVNNAATPCLVVDELSPRTHGPIGLWVGEGSGGSFANLRVQKKK